MAYQTAYLQLGHESHPLLQNATRAADLPDHAGRGADGAGRTHAALAGGGLCLRRHRHAPDMPVPGLRQSASRDDPFPQPPGMRDDSFTHHRFNGERPLRRDRED